MMSRIFLITLAIWATLPPALCQAACVELSQLAGSSHVAETAVADDSTDSSAVGHCASMMAKSDPEGDTSKAPASLAVEFEGPMCAGCDSDSSSVLVRAATIDIEWPTPGGLALAAEPVSIRTALESEAIVPRGPPRRLRSAYLEASRPLLI